MIDFSLTSSPKKSLASHEVIEIYKNTLTPQSHRPNHSQANFPRSHSAINFHRSESNIEGSSPTRQNGGENKGGSSEHPRLAKELLWFDDENSPRSLVPKGAVNLPCAALQRAPSSGVAGTRESDLTQIAANLAAVESHVKTTARENQVEKSTKLHSLRYALQILEKRLDDEIQLRCEGLRELTNVSACAT